MTFPNDNPNRRDVTGDPMLRDPMLRDPMVSDPMAPDPMVRRRSSSLGWVGLIAAMLVLGIMIYAFSNRSDVASNAPGTTTTSQSNPAGGVPTARPTAPETTGTSPAPASAPAPSR
jgi:hypothetical protein